MIFNDHSILLYRDYWVILDCNIMITYLDISQLRNFLKTFSTSMINGIQGSFNTKVLGLLLNHGLWLWYQTSSFLSFYLTLGSYGHGSYGHGSYGHGSYGRGPYGGELPLSMSLVFLKIRTTTRPRVPDFDMYPPWIIYILQIYSTHLQSVCVG